MEILKIFLLPSEPVYTRIKEIKSRLKDEIGNYFYWDYEPHISLLYLKIDGNDIKDHLPNLTQLVGNHVKDITAFDLTLNKILAPGRGVIFVDIEKSLPLRSLTNQLYLGIREYLKEQKLSYQDFEKYLRHHITIGNYIKGDKYEKATKALEKEKLPSAFDVSRIVVYREDPGTRKNLLISEFGFAG